MKKLIRITTIPLSMDKLLGNQLTYVNQFFAVTAVAADRKELERVAAKYGVRHHHIEMTRTISPFNDAVAVWKLYHFLRKEKPTIIHSHTPKAGIVAMMAGWLAGVPHRFHTVAGLPLLECAGYKRRLLNHIEKLTYRLATQVYPNSFELQNIIIKAKFCVPEKMKVIGQGSSNGIDTDHFNPAQITVEEKQNLRTELGLSPHDFVFIFVGRLVRDKGINELVTAFKNIKAKVSSYDGKPPLTPTTQHPSSIIQHLSPYTQHRSSSHIHHPTPNIQHPSPHNLKLLLVGPLEHELDPLTPETLHQIATNPHIISVGFQEEVRPYFAISNALVFPSYREGFPNVVLQSLAMELPAIVTDINGCNEIITHQQNGLLVRVKDTKGLQLAMEELLNNNTLYLNLKNVTRESIAPYEQQALWEALLEEYQGVGREMK